MKPKLKTRLSLEVEQYLRDRRAALLAEAAEIDEFLDDYNVTIPGMPFIATPTPTPVPLRPKPKRPTLLVLHPRRT